MRGVLSRLLLPALLFLGLSCVSTVAQNDNNAPLNNVAVVKLVKAGFKEKTIIAIIGTRSPRFDLSADRLIELKQMGVSEEIILAMIARQDGGTFDNGDFSSGLGIDKPASSSTGNDRAAIFGSTGDSRSGNKSRGGNSSTAGDTVTTGSATVRIIGPPTEAGAPLRLERTRPLTNDSIVELVEGGFSDGTIIRRIEQSAVEFDLSPLKVTALKKRRVNDRIIAAMKAAMGDADDGKSAPASNDSNR